MLRTLTHSRERLLKSLPPRLAESSAATSTGTMAWVDAMDRLRAGGCTLTAPEGEGGCWRLHHEGNPAAFPIDALQQLAREACLHPDLAPKVLPLLRDAVACLIEQLEPDAHEREDVHGMRQRLSALFAAHWSLLERDVGHICRHGLHRPDEATLRAAMELAMFLRNARTEACVCEAAVRAQRVDLAIGYCQAQGTKAAADRLPLLIELVQHIETASEACRYLRGTARWVKSLPRTKVLLDASPLLEFAVRFLGGLRDAKTGIEFIQAAQDFLQALSDSGRLSPGDWQALLRTMVNGVADFVQTQAWPPSAALSVLAQWMWDCELLLHRSQPKPGPAPVSLLGRFDVCSIPVKRALLSIAPCSVLPGTASRAGLVNFVHACLDSECAADFVRRLRQDPGMRWLPSQVLDRFLLGVADADARGHGRKPMPTSMPRLIAWAADAAVVADPLSKGAAVYEVASLVWRLARHVDFSVKDLQWLGGYLSLGPQASDAELQLKWLDEPNLPPAWAIPLVQGWLNHAVQTPEPSAHLLACIRAVERHLDALLAQRVAGLRLTSQDAIDRWREERGH